MQTKKSTLDTDNARSGRNVLRPHDDGRLDAPPLGITAGRAYGIPKQLVPAIQEFIDIRLAEQLLRLHDLIVSDLASTVKG